VPTRDRITAGAQAESLTADEYEAAMREDGTWPGDYDCSVEERALRQEEERG
jgi:hypothetical protein